MINYLKRKYGKIHFIGIGGIGMSGLAEYLLNKGFQVSGSDLHLTPITGNLERLGAKIYEGHNAGNIENVDLVVHTSAVHEDNPEYMEARKRNIKTIKRSELLGEITRFGFTIGVSGTHGKTTTTAMLGLILKNCEMEPTVFVGGVTKEFNNTNVLIGGNEYFVVEADEYDRTFLRLHPAAAIVNNIEAEHLDIYSDFNDVKNTFAEFCNKVPFYGFVVLNKDNDGALQIADKINATVITYGIDRNADAEIRNIRTHEGRTLFDIIYKGEELKDFEIGVFGKHNVQNAAGAFIAALEMGCEFNRMRVALKEFHGTDRRFTILYEGDIVIVDDYAHHPTEVEATLKAAEALGRRIVAVFQPHLYSRTKDFYKDFAKVFAENTDALICMDVYPAREKPIVGVSGKMIVDEIGTGKITTKIYAENNEEVKRNLKEIVSDGDIVIFMGAGTITNLAHEYASEIIGSNA